MSFISNGYFKTCWLLLCVAVCLKAPVRAVCCRANSWATCQDINSNICPPELVCSCAGAAASLEPRDSEPSMTCGATSPCIVHAAKLQVTPQLRSGWTAEGKWTSAPGVDTTYTVKGCDASSGGKYRWSSGKSTISVSVWGKMTFTVGINDQARQGGTKTIKVSENAARVTFLCPTPTG